MDCGNQLVVRVHVYERQNKTSETNVKKDGSLESVVSHFIKKSVTLDTTHSNHTKIYEISMCH